MPRPGAPTRSGCDTRAGNCVAKKAGNHGAKRKSCDVAATSAQQRAQALLNRLWQNVCIAATQRRCRLTKARHVGHIDFAARAP